MPAKFCCFLLMAAVSDAPAWAQKPGMKFAAPRNQAAQVDRVFEKENTKTVRGSIGRVMPDQKVVINVEGAAPAVAASTMRPLPRQVQGLPLDFEIQKGDDNNTVVVNNVRPSVVTAWQNSPVAKNRVPELDQSIKQLEANFQKYIEMPTPSKSEFKLIADSAQEVHEAFLTSYAATPVNDTAELNRLARFYAPLNDFRRKATYGLDDNFWPEVYEKMYQHSRSVAAIALKGDDAPVGTGALVGSNLVLTCSHVFEEDVKEYAVWLDFEETSAGQLPRKVFPITALVFEGEPGTGLGTQSLDFVLLRIGPDQTGKTCEQHGFKPLPWTTQVCRLEDPVYVIGHPNRAVRTVHDNARVIFPYILGERRKAELDARVRSQILDHVERNYADLPERNRMRDALLDDYAKSFKKTDDGGFKYVSEVRGPSIGMDSDTSGGNSGAPVFLRRGAGKAAGIVGVFVGGATHGADRADFLKHEVALPITEVIAQLDAQMANWKTALGIVVQSP